MILSARHRVVSPASFHSFQGRPAFCPWRGAFAGGDAMWRDEEIVLSPRQKLTQEGFLRCDSVPIARTGEQLYHATELPLFGITDGMIRVMRDAAEVFDPKSIAAP
jgi:hypothetical protein